MKAPASAAVYVAELVADRLCSGLFDAYLHLACTPYLANPSAAPGVAHACDRLAVADVMASGVHALPPVIAVAEVVHALSGTTFSVRIPGQAARSFLPTLPLPNHVVSVMCKSGKGAADSELGTSLQAHRGMLTWDVRMGRRSR